MSRTLVAISLLFLVGAAAPRLPADCGETYRVVRGDTLAGIARRCGSSVAILARANRIRNPNLILVGQRLAIPGGGSAVARRPDARPSAEAQVYRIKRGDTLFSLARWSGTGLPALLAANPGINPRAMEIGDSVQLPAGAVRPEPARARERGGSAAAAPSSPPSQEQPAAREPEQRRPRREREAEVEAM